MTDFASTASIVAALAAAGNGGPGMRQEFYKTTLTVVASADYSGWMMAGAPAAGVAPTTWATPTQATTGAWNPKFVNPTTQTARLLLSDVTQTNAGQNLTWRDRLGHMGGLSGILATAQTVTASLTTPAASGRCLANGTDTEWFLEWYTATGATAVTATVAVTYSDASTGNVTISLPVSVPAYRFYRIQSANASGLAIISIQSVTLSATTGTAGNFGVTATKRLANVPCQIANMGLTQDWAALGMPIIGSGACLCPTFWCSTTSLGTVVGTLIAGAA